MAHARAKQRTGVRGFRRMVACMAGLALVLYQLAMAGMAAPARAGDMNTTPPCHIEMADMAASPDQSTPQPEPCPMMLGAACVMACAIPVAGPSADLAPMVKQARLTFVMAEPLSRSDPPPQRPPR
jgi:hypothetical protein